MLDRVRRTGRGLWWYLRQATGEAKWDDYLARCRAEGREPMSRREFERHRDQHREESARHSCC
ncbi:CstA-like transporter-associated (seleno)protein [Nocardioides jishulii]|uniref:YbdD/YjiX family protein n=1 Tax=Nocardioides jishulii TaxID=2575440 RepID=A0A4U2YQG1_9ACTN|nr:YbdD/YjiX family protein [Nocardioides jishulii]QCX26564.1 YbdD/YjiX family protein [Nocardioides jishulii]TKI63629.1 YbdD/YjiX family protein [Nocardioides jishulii]